MDFVQIAILIGIGVLLGFASGVTGISAVHLVVAILYLLPMFALAILPSLGTSLLVDVIGAGAVTYLYYRHENVDFKLGVLMGIISFTFAVLGAFVARSIGLSSEHLLASALGVFQILIGLSFIVRGVRKKEIENSEELDKSRVAIWLENQSDSYKKIIIIVTAIVLGLMGGMFGAGGGFAITFLLVFLFGFESHKAVGTACLVMLFTASGAMLVYAACSYVNLEYGLIIGVACIFGALFGTKFAHTLSEKHLTIALGAIILVFGIFMLLPK